jgi:hypothetical protein
VESKRCFFDFTVGLAKVLIYNCLKVRRCMEGKFSVFMPIPKSKAFEEFGTQMA